MKHIKKLNEDIGGDIYIVTAQSFNSRTGEPLAVARDEEINVKEKQLFHGAKSILDVHDKY